MNDDAVLTDLSRGDFESVDETATVSEVIGVMSKNMQYAVPVVNGQGYAGLVTASDIVSSNKPTSTKAKTVASPIHMMSGESTIGDALEYMWVNNLKALPIGEGKKITGLLTFWDVLGWSLRRDELAGHMASEVEAGDCPEIGGKKQLDSARVGLRESQISDMVLVDEQMNKLIDEREYASRVSKLPRKRAKLGERRGEKVKMLASDAGNLAERVSVQVGENDPLIKLMEEMHKKRATYGKVGGKIVTFRDVVRYLAEEGRREDAVRRQKIKVISKHYLSPATLERFERELRKFADYYDGKHGLDRLKELKVYVKEYSREGGSRDYEMKASLVADTGNLHVKKEGWDPVNVFNEVVEALKTSVRRGG